MFDVLGFKNLRMKKGTAGLYQSYTRVLRLLTEFASAGERETIRRDGRDLIIPKTGVMSVRMLLVSDVVILSADGDDYGAFTRIITAAFQLFVAGFNGILGPFRGAIGYGDLAVDEQSTWIGSAIEDTHALEECQVWAGCSLTKACAVYIEERGFLKESQAALSKAAENETDPFKRKRIKDAARRIVEYDIPLQKRLTHSDRREIIYTTEKGLVLDWTSSVYHDASLKVFATTSDEHAKKIADNTRRFEQWARMRSA